MNMLYSWKIYLFISYDVNELKFTERILWIWITINIFIWASYIVWITAINFSRYLQVINNQRKSIANWTTISNWVSILSWNVFHDAPLSIVSISFSMIVNLWESPSGRCKLHCSNLFFWPTIFLASLIFYTHDLIRIALALIWQPDTIG